MAYILDFPQSNKADLHFFITATDADPDSAGFGTAIDFTGALVTYTITDEDGCQRLTATIGSGITQPVATTLEVYFIDESMKALCPGSYKHGAVCQLNGETFQLLTGTISVIDGVAQI